jgi:Multicopper oxidase
MLGKTFRCEAGVEIWQSNEGAMNFSRRGFLKMAGAVTGGVLLPRVAERVAASGPMNPARQEGAAVYSIRIGASPVEIAPQRIVSTVTYNGQFPGPLLRFKEGQPVTIDIHNDTDTPEQLHWHGQKVPVDVGALRSLRGRRDCGSITPTTGPAPTLPQGSTADRLGRCTSTRRRIRADTTARYSSS